MVFKTYLINKYCGLFLAGQTDLYLLRLRTLGKINILVELCKYNYSDTPKYEKMRFTGGLVLKT